MVGESTLGGEREKNKQKTENIKTWFSSDFWAKGFRNYHVLL